MPRISQRVAIWSAGSLENIGDQLLPLLLREHVTSRLPDVATDIFCPFSRSEHPKPLRLSSDGQWDEGDAYDAIVVPGGGVIAGPPFRHPLMQIFSFGPHPATFLPGRFTAWHAVGIEDGTPLPNRPAWREYQRSVVNRLNFATVRSIGAQRRLAAVGMDVARCPDLFFCLPVQSQPYRRNIGRRPRLGAVLGSPFLSPRLLDSVLAVDLADRCPGTVDLCVVGEEVLAATDLPAGVAFGFAHLAAVVEACAAAKASGWEVTLFGCQNMYGDDKYCRTAARLAGVALLELPVSRWQELAARLGTQDMLVTSRYHTTILAARTGLPVLAVEPSQPGASPTKLAELMADLGRADAYWSLTHGAIELTTRLHAALDDGYDWADAYTQLHCDASVGVERLVAALKMALASDGPPTER